MDASTALRSSRRLIAPPVARLARVAAATALALLAAGGGLLCVRRLSGALQEPLPPIALIVLGVTLAAAMLVIRRLLVWPHLPRRAAYVVWAAPSIVLAIWAVGVSLGGSDALGLAILFGALLLEEGWSWGRFRPSESRDVDGQTAAGSDLQEERIPLPQAPFGMIEDAADDEMADGLTQRIVRRGPASDEVMEGLVRVDFAAAQRHAVAHVAICPPMQRVPVCYAEQIDGPPARLKLGDVQAYGVRFELKLDEPAEEATFVLVEFSIQERPAAAE